MKNINYASSSVNMLKASLNDDARVIIYDRHMFIVKATGGQSSILYLSVVHYYNTSLNMALPPTRRCYQSKV